MDVVGLAAQAFQFPAQRLFTGADFLELLAKVRVSLVETLPVTGEIAAGLAGEEAEGGCEDHPLLLLR